MNTKPYQLDDLKAMGFKNFQARYSVQTEPGPFERRLYLGSNEMLEEAYKRLSHTRGASLSVLGGVDQTLTMIASSGTNFNVMADINPMAVEYGNIRMGLTQIAGDASEYIQKLTSRQIPEDKKPEFNNAVNNRDYGKIWKMLREQKPASFDVVGQTYRKLTEMGFIVDARKAFECFLTVANKTQYGPGHFSEPNEKERSMQLFFEFFENNPSNWLFDPDKYHDIQARTYRGEIKIIHENIFETTLHALGSLFEDAGLTLGFFYDSNTLHYEKSEGVTRLVETVANFPSDKNSLWISCNSSGRATIRTIDEAVKEARIIKSFKE